MKDLSKKGAILITTLWIVTILSALSISVAHRSAITLRISAYQTDKLRSALAARAGLVTALALKQAEYKRESQSIDALSQKWANNPDMFKKIKFGDGFYTVGYENWFGSTFLSESDNRTLYGISDESSRLNINKATSEMLTRLLVMLGQDESTAEEIAYSIIDWRDDDDLIGQEKVFQRLVGAEGPYYKGLEKPYACKNSPFELIEELLFVKGITSELLYGSNSKNGAKSPGLKDFVTIYTKGEVNINTASENVLAALFGVDYPDLPRKIIVYRLGRDGVAGTQDDRWFSTGTFVIERGDEGMVEVKNLMDGDWFGNAYGIDTEEYARIQKLTKGIESNKITASSKIYRVKSKGEVRKVIAEIEAVYAFELNKGLPVVKFWYQD